MTDEALRELAAEIRALRKELERHRRETSLGRQLDEFRRETTHNQPVVITRFLDGTFTVPPNQTSVT